jgi:hypothetical protein
VPSSQRVFSARSAGRQPRQRRAKTAAWCRHTKTKKWGESPSRDAKRAASAAPRHASQQ